MAYTARHVGRFTNGIGGDMSIELTTLESLRRGEQARKWLKEVGPAFLRLKRKKSGLGMREYGIKYGVSASLISQIECGKIPLGRDLAIKLLREHVEKPIAIQGE